eukprot:m.59684 g.59684  ORF g.59684 m.59684 type:complete len:429 (+) comp13012_c1_seq1:879-2165(+)
MCRNVCGDSIAFGEEECDEGTDNSDTDPNACRTDCILPFCGDGIVDHGEACDDGNTDSGDGCDNSCILEAGFTCDTAVDPTTCTDIDECGGGLGPCSSPGTGSCTNIPGGFTCNCQNQYTGTLCDEEPAICFPTGSKVQEWTGGQFVETNIETLVIGSKVRCVNVNGQDDVCKVYAHQHRLDPLEDISYLEITTDGGNSLVLSYYHLMWAAATDPGAGRGRRSTASTLPDMANPSFIPASEVTVGMYVAIVTGADEFSFEQVTSNSFIIRDGAYAPAVSNGGVIIVDNFVASSYVQTRSTPLDDSHFSDYYLDFWLWIETGGYALDSNRDDWGLSADDEDYLNPWGVWKMRCAKTPLRRQLSTLISMYGEYSFDEQAFADDAPGLISDGTLSKRLDLLNVMPRYFGDGQGPTTDPSWFPSVCAQYLDD